MNDSLKRIGEVLLGAENVFLFPHTNADGDALGSCEALARALNQKGVECRILIEDTIADNLIFLDEDGLVTMDCNLFGDEPEVCVLIDNGEVDRNPERKETFLAGKTKICIDHHPTSKPFADYNYIEPEAAATGEIIFDLLKAMDCPLDEKIGGALFAAITTDCGNFQYSNTTKRTFEIMVELMDTKFNLSEISNTIYQNNPLERIKVETEILNTLEIIAEGKVAVAFVTTAMLEKCGAKMEHTEGLINIMRGIAGVEVAVFLKEKDENCIKVSMRAKSYADVSAVCAKYGGGGHIRAAGCTLETNMAEAIKTVKEELPKVV